VASKSDRFVASSDMAKLLDLLNSSESSDDDFNGAENPPEYQAGEAVAEEVEETSEIFPAEPNDRVAAAQETVENRFAAHIVHGMSKFIRS